MGIVELIDYGCILRDRMVNCGEGQKVKDDQTMHGILIGNDAFSSTDASPHFIWERSHYPVAPWWCVWMLSEIVDCFEVTACDIEEAK